MEMFCLEFSNGNYLTHNLHHIPFNCRPNWSHGLFSNTHIICRLTMAWLFSNLLMVLSSARTVQFSIFDNKITSKKPQTVWRIFPFILNCCLLILFYIGIYGFFDEKKKRNSITKQQPLMLKIKIFVALVFKTFDQICWIQWFKWFLFADSLLLQENRLNFSIYLVNFTLVNSNLFVFICFHLILFIKSTRLGSVRLLFDINSMRWMSKIAAVAAFNK